MRVSLPSLCILALATLAGPVPPGLASTGVHSSHLWHMHQPFYWPDESGWNPGRTETAYETITLGHSANDVFDIFNKDDRVGDYQRYPPGRHRLHPGSPRSRRPRAIPSRPNIVL